MDRVVNDLEILGNDLERVDKGMDSMRNDLERFGNDLERGYKKLERLGIDLGGLNKKGSESFEDIREGIVKDLECAVDGPSFEDVEMANKLVKRLDKSCNNFGSKELVKRT